MDKVIVGELFELEPLLPDFVKDYEKWESTYDEEDLSQEPYDIVIPALLRQHYERRFCVLFTGKSKREPRTCLTAKRKISIKLGTQAELTTFKHNGKTFQVPSNVIVRWLKDDEPVEFQNRDRFFVAVFDDTVAVDQSK